MAWLKICNAVLGACILFSAVEVSAQEQRVASEVEVKPGFQGLSDKVIKAFNAEKVDDLVALFSRDGEWIDENGTVYQGHDEIRALLTTYFEHFKGAKLRLHIDSFREIGPVAIEEGLREVTIGENGPKAAVRFISVLTKTNSGWEIASLRDFDTAPVRTPRDFLEPLEWLVGDWVNEGVDSTVEISYSWSEDGNFLLGNYEITRGGESVLKCSQRIGWDPLVGAARSWMFDSDGGFSEGRWAEVQDGWVIKTQAVLPDGTTGSATITLTPESKERFVMKGTERFAGNHRDEDFQVVIVRKMAKSAPKKE